MYVGIDIEQFVHDPYGSGIQRVLQYLALEWPDSEVQADFVVPLESEYGLLTPAQAAELIGLAFATRDPDADLRIVIADHLATLNLIRVKPGELLAIYDSWLLPEVSYLPQVLGRFELFAKCVPTAMIGYDTLPMREPGNYRFKPGGAAFVSEYFRHLAAAESVICISEVARASILSDLRRDPAKATIVAHPGGDHLAETPQDRLKSPIPARFIRLGTLEARKRPQQILAAFRLARANGLDAELLFIGQKSSSDAVINSDLTAAVSEGIGVTWVQGASDEQVHDMIKDGSVFLSLGTEGFGIPVLEAIRLGTPVLFDVVQPAGDLMDGKGARRVPALAEEDLIQAFQRYSQGA